MRETLRALYRASENAEDFFTFPVFFAAVCEKNGISRASSKESLSEACVLRVLEDANRLLDGYPLQYYLGEADFYGRVFQVREGVLIPRADTETLVRLALQDLPQGGAFYDFCCGSGCIAVTLLTEREDAVGIAVDVSDDALLLCSENAARFSVRDRLLLRKRDLLHEPGGNRKLSLLCMNPPYIPTADLDRLPQNVRREPSLALDGGADGLDFYRRVLLGLPQYLCADGVALFEIGYDEAESVPLLCEKNGYRAEVFPDENGLSRVVRVTFCEKKTCEPCENMVE